jgi:hypothetical protein
MVQVVRGLLLESLVMGSKTIGWRIASRILEWGLESRPLGPRIREAHTSFQAYYKPFNPHRIGHPGSEGVPLG